MAPFITEIPHTRTTILGDDTHHFLVYVCVCGERHFFVCSVHILNTLYAQTIEKNVCIETVSYVSERRLEAWWEICGPIWVFIPNTQQSTIGTQNDHQKKKKKYERMKETYTDRRAYYAHAWTLLASISICFLSLTHTVNVFIRPSTDWPFIFVALRAHNDRSIENLPCP